MPLFHKKQKIVATLVPVSALSSAKLNKKDQGTFSAGLPFIDWLVKTRQNGWVLLPLSETQQEIGSMKNHVPSPYKGYGIGLDPRYLPRVSPAFAKASAGKRGSKGFERFVYENKYWLSDYALFC